MSIDSQIKEMQAMAERERLDVIEIKKESFSAKQSGNRPVFNELLHDLRNGKYEAILTWAPDRLSRNAGDLGSLVDLMDINKLQRIRTFGQSFSNTPNEKFLLMILCSQAKLENDNRGVNVKRGIRAKCEMGWRPCMPPIGYFTRAATGGARDTILDEERAPYIRKMFEMSASGKSGRHIYQYLIDNKVKTRKGKDISLSMIYNMLKNPFYYGEFEYPIGSGIWYKGKHPKLVSKEQFDKVQKQLKVPLKSKWGSKEFPYKSLLRCYSCGSGVVGEEKLRELKNGSVNRHIYYHCSRKRNYNCKEPYVTETVVSNELIRLANTISSSIINPEPGLVLDINRFLSITEGNRCLKPVPLEYMVYILKRGSVFEKTRLARNIDLQIYLKLKQLVIKESLDVTKSRESREF